MLRPMTLLNSGTTKKYSENWSQAFGASPTKSKAKPTAKKASAASGTKKKKAPAKKSGKR